MRKIVLSSVIILFGLLQSAMANKYYWVGNGGNWTDVSHHWAKSSDGTIMYNTVPGINDTVYFDANSFSMSGQSVQLDTLIAECAMMDWSGIDISVYFYSGMSDTLRIYGNCILSDSLSFNLTGFLEFAAPSPLPSFLDFSATTLQCDVLLAADSAVLLSPLYLPLNHLSMVDGSFATNGHNVTCKHFNTDSTLKNSTGVADPHWFSNDTLTVRGSLALSDNLDFQQNGPLYLNFSLNDTNYINSYSNTLPGDVVFKGTKKMFLRSPLLIGGTLDFAGGGEFYTKGYNVTAATLKSRTSVNRKLDFSSATITLNAPGNTLYLQSQGLNLKTDTAILNINYAGNDTVNIITGKAASQYFKQIYLPSATVLVFNSLSTSLTTFGIGSTIGLARGTTLTTTNITTSGDCKSYNYLKAFCANCPTCGEDADCALPNPVIQTSAPITLSFLKIKNIKVSGLPITANQSFDEGNNSGWNISEPATPETLYWVGGSGNWNDPEHWSATSGVFSPACIPTRLTHVVFDAASFNATATITIDEKAYCNDLTWTNTIYNGTVSGRGALMASGDLTLHALSHFEPAKGIYLQANAGGPYIITNNGAEFNCDINISGTRQWRLADNLSMNGTMTLEEGSLNLNSKNLSCNALLAGGSKIRTLDYSNSIIYLNGSDTTWKSSGSNLTLVNNSSSVQLIGSGPDYMLVDAGNRSFDLLDIRCPKARIANGIDCNLIKILPGTLLECEPLKTIRFDSIVANGLCDNPITLSVYSGASDTALFRQNNPNDTLLLDHVVIRDLCADITGGRQYNAQNSIGLNRFSGWNISSGSTAKAYYWSGLVSTSWHVPGNWKVNNIAALCLPSPLDTVIFDNAHLSVPGSHDTAIISENAYCGMMIWENAITGKPALLLGSDLITRGSVILCDSLTVDYTADYSSSEANAPTFTFLPQNSNSNFNPSCRSFGVNISIQGQQITDTVRLLNDLMMNTLNTLAVYSGTFNSNAHRVNTAIISTIGGSKKNINFENSDITATYAFLMQGNSTLKLNMDASNLVMDDNFLFYNKFDGGGHNYHNVEFRSRPTTYSQIFYQADIESSDSIGFLKINPGLHLRLKSSVTMVFDSIMLDGDCADSIYINTSTAGINATMTLTTTDSIRGICLNVKNISATYGASGIYSKDLGGNTKWNFSSSKLSTSAFILPPTTCFSDSVHFTNTTVALSGDLSDLSFTWTFGDTDSSYAFEPAHLYAHNTEYSVSLLSTDTASGCSDLYRDTLTIYRPEVHLGTTESDLAICVGDSVTFYANTANPSPLYQFMVAGDSIIQSSDSIFATANLINGDEIYVMLSYQGCTDTSNHYTFTVNSLPIVGFVSDEPDTALCAADTIVFSGTGADNYQLYRNGLTYGSYSTTDTWTIPDAVDGDLFSLSGMNTTTGCRSNSTDTLTVTVYPLPAVGLISSDPDLSICSGNQVIFTTSGAALYQFFLNGDTLGTTSAVDTMALTTLEDGDIITTAGISSSGCLASSAIFFEFEVANTPVVHLSSSDPDNVICQGELVTFYGTGADQYQFAIDGLPIGPFMGSGNFPIDSLTNGQVITVTGLMGVCPAQADSSITIDVRPTITWSWSADEICAYDTIHFMAHGDVLYQYFINGNPIGLPGVDSSFNAVSLTNGQQITVGGSAGACTPSAVTITVNPVPIVPMTCSDPDTAICTGQTLTFSGTGALKYQYSVDGDTIGPYSFFNTYTTDSITNGQSVSLTAISAEGCLGTSPNIYTLTVEPYPVVTLSQSDPDLTICEGDTVSFTSGGADFYEFFVNGTSQGLAGPGNVFATSALVNGANVLVEGTTGICTAPAVSIYSYTVHPYPIVTFTALTPLSYCQGDTLKLSAGGAFSYEYFIDGLSTGAPTMNNLFTSTTLTSGQNVSVTGSRFGCASSGNTDYTVSVNNYPLVGLTADLPSLDLCYGEPVVFSATGADHYIFYLDNLPVSTDSLFTTADLEAGQTITLAGGNGACWVNADTSISLNVHYINLTLDCSQPSGVICAGDQPSFNAGGADLYEFFIDGISQGTPSASGTFAPAQLTNGQVVSVAGTSSSTGCTQMAAENLLIHVYPSPELPALDAICEGDSALLSSSVPGNLIWYHNASLIAEASGQSIYIDQPGSYQVALSAGGDSVCLSAGTNFYGQLGDNTQTNSLEFTEALNLGPITALACGEDFTLALLSDGTVKSWGKNEFGALGTGNFTNAAAPVNAGAISNATKIGAGMRHSLALLQDSTLLAWGDNTLGQLGLGSYSTCNFPYPVPTLDHIVDIAAGDNFSLALTADGHIWAWGQNQVGQLGDGTVTNSNHPVLVTGIDQVAAIRAGGNHSIALKDDGSLWVWGANNAGQLGNGTFIGSQSPVKVVLPIGLVSFDGGFSHTIAADSAGHVYCWGDNTFGQIGNGTNTPATYPVKVSAAGNTTLVRAGKYSSYALRTDKNVFSWGLNTSGQLGQQHTNAVSVPMAAQTLFGVNTMDAGLAHCAALSGNLHTCSSNIISLQVEPVPDVTVYLQDLTLYTTTSGSAYQWYYNGNLIPGAIDSTLQLAAMGAYAVEVSFDNGCTAFSDDYQYQSGIDSETSGDLYALYPNPNNGIFTIRLSGSALAEEIERIRVIDVVGRIVYTDNSSAQPELILMDLSGTPNGMYVIEILLQGGQKIRKPFMIN